MNKLLMVILALMLMAGCSSEPSKPAEKPQPKPAEFVSGRTAFQKLYVAAHGWARDAQPYRLESQVTPDANGKDGKAGVWRGGFASAVQHGTEPYLWSGSDAPGAPSRGVNPGTEDTYSPSNASTQIFDPGFLKVDSDKAFEVAQKHGGDKLLEKAPDTPVSYVLEWSGPTSELVWHVIYGSSRESATLRVAVNATSGEFLRVEK